MTNPTPVLSKPARERKPILNNDDFYWEIGDDGEDDGFIHIVCTIDGSEIKIPIKEILKGL